MTKSEAVNEMKHAVLSEKLAMRFKKTYFLQ